MTISPSARAQVASGWVAVLNQIRRFLQRGYGVGVTAFWLLAGPLIPQLHAEVLYSPVNGLALAKQRAESIGCASHLAQIMRSAAAWSMDNGDAAPPGLQALADYMESPNVLFCPANGSAERATNWAVLDWSRIDYSWDSTVDWNNPTNVACRCKIHENSGQADGFVRTGGYRSGWPWIVASPWEVLATPGEDARFEVTVTSAARQPLTYQWRREAVHYETNVVRTTNPDDPNGVYWQTNVAPVFIASNLPNETNATLSLAGVQTNDSGYYSVAVSNELGCTASPRGPLHVDASFAGITTNEYWSEVYCVNNLRMLGLLGSLWAADHQQQTPRSLTVMTNADGSWVFGWPSSLFCRSDEDRRAPTDWSEVDFLNTSYEILPGDSLDPSTVFCRCRFHGFYAQMNGEVVWQPFFTAIQHRPDQGFEVSFRLFAGKTHVLEASSDLVNWSAITSFASTNGPIRFTDTGGPSSRFYRLRQP